MKHSKPLALLLVGTLVFGSYPAQASRNLKRGPSSPLTVGGLLPFLGNEGFRSNAMSLETSSALQDSLAQIGIEGDLPPLLEKLTQMDPFKPHWGESFLLWKILETAPQHPSFPKKLLKNKMKDGLALLSTQEKKNLLQALSEAAKDIERRIEAESDSGLETLSNQIQAEGAIEIEALTALEVFSPVVSSAFGAQSRSAQAVKKLHLATTLAFDGTVGKVQKQAALRIIRIGRTWAEQILERQLSTQEAYPVSVGEGFKNERTWASRGNNLLLLEALAMTNPPQVLLFAEKTEAKAKSAARFRYLATGALGLLPLIASAEHVWTTSGLPDYLFGPVLGSFILSSVSFLAAMASTFEKVQTTNRIYTSSILVGGLFAGLGLATRGFDPTLALAVTALGTLAAHFFQKEDFHGFAPRPNLFRLLLPLLQLMGYALTAKGLSWLFIPPIVSTPYTLMGGFSLIGLGIGLARAFGALRTGIPLKTAFLRFVQTLWVAGLPFLGILLSQEGWLSVPVGVSLFAGWITLGLLLFPLARLMVLLAFSPSHWGTPKSMFESTMGASEPRGFPGYGTRHIDVD